MKLKAVKVEFTKEQVELISQSMWNQRPIDVDLRKEIDKCIAAQHTLCCYELGTMLNLKGIDLDKFLAKCGAYK